MPQNQKKGKHDSRPDQPTAVKGRPGAPSPVDQDNPHPSGDSLKKQGDKLEEALHDTARHTARGDR